MIIRIVLSLILLLSGYAQANEVYVIKNVKISSNNKSASIARNDAIEAGQLKAFRGLVKLHYPEAESKISKIDKEDIFSTVEGYELSEEKRSATNYYAKLKVKFSRSHVDKLMQELGANFSEATAPQKTENFIEQNDDEVAPMATTPSNIASPTLNTLVVPVFIQNGRNYWFDDDNSWLNTWQKHKQSNKFVLPLVDLEDLALLNKDITNKNLIDLAPLLEKYNVNNIAVYTLEDLGEGKNHQITLKVNYINKYHYAWQTHHFQDDGGNDLSLLLNKAYDKTQNFNFDSNLDTCCKVANDLVSVEPQVVMVDFPIEKISDWLNLQQILKGISYITDVRLEKMTVNLYHFSFTSSISIDDLKGLFRKYGFILEEQNNNIFMLTKAMTPQEISHTDEEIDEKS